MDFENTKPELSHNATRIQCIHHYEKIKEHNKLGCLLLFLSQEGTFKMVWRHDSK